MALHIHISHCHKSHISARKSDKNAPTNALLSFFSMDSKKDCLFNCKSWSSWLLQCSDQAVSSVIPQVNQDEEFQCFGMKKRNLLPSLTVVCQLPHVLTKRFYRVKNWPTLCLIGILCQILNILNGLDPCHSEAHQSYTLPTELSGHIKYCGEHGFLNFKNTVL